MLTNFVLPNFDRYVLDFSAYNGTQGKARIQAQARKARDPSASKSKQNQASKAKSNKQVKAKASKSKQSNSKQVKAKRKQASQSKAKLQAQASQPKSQAKIKQAKSSKNIKYIRFWVLLSVFLQTTFFQCPFNHGVNMLSHMLQSFNRAHLTSFINLLLALNFSPSIPFVE